MSDDAFSATIAGPAPSLQIGKLFADRYEIVGELGKGGMGAVFRVRDKVLDELIALKILSLPPDNAEEAVARFRREVRIARRVTHPNVARTFDLGEHEGLYFLTMELVDGESLRQLLAREGPLPAAGAASIGAAICDGLAAAHAADVVHRDLKPANVLLEPGGRVVITDFGIARTVADERSTIDTVGVLGTPAYMAPEQVTGQAVDARTDLYALGVVFFEMLTGRLPFEGPTPLAAASARLLEDPPDPRDLVAAPEGLADLVLRCLARDPKERPSSAGEIAAALRGLAAGAAEAIPASRRAPPKQAGKAARPTGGSGLFAATSPGNFSLAVLPFRYRGPADGGVLADGLTDELIDVLSMTRDLRVLASGATARFRDDRDPRTIGDALSVDVIVDGTVQQAGEKVRITARLIQVSEAVQVWSGSFDGRLEDVFSLQESMSKRIAEVLRLKLDTIGYGSDAPAEAVQLYFAARQRLHKYQVAGADGAHTLLERCLQLAPRFKPALAFHAMATLRSWFLPGVDSTCDWEAEAHASVARALAEADELAETQLAAASLSLATGDFSDAARRVGRALTIAPTCAAAHDFLGRLQCEAGRSKEGLRHCALALDLDPTLYTPRIAAARVHALHGRLEAFEQTLLRLRELGGPPMIGALQLEIRVAAWYGDHERVRRLVSEMEQFNNPASRLMVVVGRYALGDLSTDEFEAASATELEGGPANPRYMSLADQIFAEVHCLRERPDLAMRCIERGAGSVLIDREWLDRCPALEPARALAGFEEVARKISKRVAAIWNL